MAYVLAADLGGTNLRTGVVSDDGSVVYQREVPTPQTGSASDIADTIVAEAQSCIAGIDAAPLAFGVAAAALVDSSGRQVLSAPNLPQLDGFGLAEEIRTRLGLNVLLENDATAAAIGEQWTGASRDVSSSICITLGTGVGGGLIIDGRPHRGSTGTAGEIGHICVEPDGVECGCGSHGCLEQYASATAIARMAAELAHGNEGSNLSSIANLTAKEVYAAGVNGDPAALEAFRRMGRYLGIAVADLINVLNPDMFVIGGGAAAGWDLFIEHVSREVSFRAFRHPREAARIVRAKLGNQAGMLGAGRVALDSSEHEAK